MTGFVAALFAVIIGFDAPQSVSIPATYMKGFYQDAVNTRATGIEVVYCLIGYERDGHYRVTAVVKPTQTPYRVIVTRGSMTRAVSGVWSTPCIVGTILDLHTHPFADPVPRPSQRDIETWERNRARYPLRGIIEQGPDSLVRISIWGPDGILVRDLRSL